MLSVTVRQLEVFKTVVDQGGFSAAAKALDISQPSVSMQIRAIEARTKQRLFERHKGTAPILTAIGRRVYDYAIQVLEQSDRTSADIRSFQSAEDNILSFSVQRFIANNLLSKPLTDFAQRNSGIEIIANIAALERVRDNILAGETDLGMFMARGEWKGLRSEVIGHQELVFITAPGHPLAFRRNLCAEEIASFPFIEPVKGSLYWQLLQSVFKDIGLSGYTTIMQSQQTLMRKEFLQSGNGIACALRFGLREELERGELVMLDVEGGPFQLEVRIGYPTDRRISKASSKFVDYLSELKDQHAFSNVA